MNVKILKQNEFPLLERYKKVFPITEDTIFAYDNKIYTNNKLPNDLIVHECVHHEQQKHYGLDNWVDKYLTDNEFRLKMELDAYIIQLESIKDRNKRAKVWIESARNLSSELYGGIINYSEAIKLLKI